MKVMDLPFGRFRDKGQPIDNVSNYDSSQETCLFLSVLGSITDKKLLFGTASGMLKQVAGSEFDVSKRTTASTKLSDGDEVIFIQELPPELSGETLVMQSEQGMFLRIEASAVPEKKKSAIGVRGIRLSEQDRLTHMYLLSADDPVKTAQYEPAEVVLNRLRIGTRDTKGVRR